MRTYIRHPTSIPIHVCAGGDKESRVRVRNLSAGGLCFITDKPVKVGTMVEFDIPVTSPDYHGRGVIVWRREQSPQSYEVGVRFTSDDEFFRTRMVEQVCQIEDYRQRLALKGRQLTSEEAALEWIERYSANFDSAAQH
ncbi:PilZ domain-containing protein [Cellvibrio sp. NN19]|uniref:PilZ domain-containing protein n=1 Tax=Cellvibrio chitinivorans TaxID=3102792 RepID=UPI002B413BAE|nr:PilZ domain-containing protein [Cellvibrio sp. NN19]